MGWWVASTLPLAVPELAGRHRLDRSIFEASLTADGFTEIETKRYEARPTNGEHGHHFTVRGPILDGAFTVTVGGQERTYRPGDAFEVGAGDMHCEAVGPGGLELLVGRKY